jgi:predicted secreted hydrolase
MHSRSMFVVALCLAGLYACGGRTDSAASGDRVGEVPATSRLAGLLGSDDAAGFPRATAPIDFRFPADHGPHPRFRNEWWYVTGNLDAFGGERFGFELTLFRFSLSPQPVASESAWATNQVYIGHFAVTDVETGRFHVAERYSRGAAGLAGAQADPFRVWLEDWSIRADAADGPHGMPWRLAAGGEQVSIDILLNTAKPAVLNGDRGRSQKSADPGNASYYYSMTRLETEGRLRVGDRDYTVSGLSWLDREWSSSALASDQAGWDWFALQFDDGTELMFYRLRKIDGTADRFSAGTFVDADGGNRHLGIDDVELTATEHWTNEVGDSYPVVWRMRVPVLDLDVTISPVLEDQELETTVRYWEGAVDAAGTRAGRDLTGRGYVEMTGYSD